MHSRTSEFPSHWGFAQDFRTKKKKNQWIQKMKQQDVRSGVETAYTTKRKSNGSQTEKPAATAKRKKHGVQFFSVLPRPTGRTRQLPHMQIVSILTLLESILTLPALHLLHRLLLRSNHRDFLLVLGLRTPTGHIARQTRRIDEVGAPPRFGSSPPS